MRPTVATRLARRRPRSPLWTGALLVLAAVAVAAVAGTASYDDAYITYAYARSVAEGRGLAWGDHAVYGTSSPGLALALGTLERVAPLGIPVWGAVLTALAAAAAALALAGLGRREGWACGGAAAGLLWILWPGRFGQVGGEVPLAVAAVALAALAFAAGRPLAAGFALALATILRPEAGLAAPCLAGALALSNLARAPTARESWRRALAPVARAAGVAAPLVAAWLVVVWTRFGTLVPRTLEAKRAHAESALHAWDSSGWRVLVEQGQWLAERAAGPHGILLAFAVAGLVGLRRLRPLLASALALWGALHLLLVARLGVPRYFWYALPFELAVIVCAGLGVEWVARLEEPMRRPARTTAAILLGVWASASAGELFGLAASGGDPRRLSYGAVAEYADRYPEGTTLAAYEVGYLGFYSHRPVLDLLGLVTAETPLDAIRRGDLAAVRERLDPDLLMMQLNGGGLFRSTLGAVPRFLAEYRLDHLQLEGEPHLAVYRRAGLEGRGEVELDLLPPLAAAGARVEFGGFSGEQGLVLVLAPGERRTVELPPGPGLRFRAGIAAPAGDATAIVELEEGAGTRPLDRANAIPEPRWRVWRTAVARRTAPARLALACAAASEGDCWIGQPHLARPPRRRGEAG